MLHKIKNIFSSRIRNQILGINRRNLEFISQGNPRRYYKLADDKFITKQILEKHNLSCPKTYGVIEKIGEIESIWQTVDNQDALVIKPANGSGGNGILILRKKNGIWHQGKDAMTLDTIFSHIANIIFGVHSMTDTDKAIIEECIFPHPFFASIYESGVPDFRVILFRGTPVMGMLRFPTAKSHGKANIHQGGLGIGIDMKTGLLKQAYDGRKYHNTHPDSGSIINGREVPYWKEILQLSVKTAAVFPLEYLGVDVIIDKNKGPIVMEINVRPGLAIQLANKKGLAEDLAKIQ